MGLFDKEKLTEMANKAKETVKESWDEAKAEQERRKELGLLDDVSIKLEYKGGHPALKKEKDCTLKITNEDITISYGISQGKIDFSSITGMHYETAEQISRRVTATRLLTLGVFAFAFKKKKKDSEKYLTVEFTNNNYKTRENVQIESEETIKEKNDPYEELKKLKELLDMGIINEEEFESKKKELLNL